MYVVRYLTLFALISGCGGSDTGLLHGKIDVQHYSITLKINPSNSYLEGEAVIKAIHTDTLEWLPLSLTGLTITYADVNGTEVEPVRHRSDVLVPLAERADRSIVTLKYTGIPHTGVYITEYEDHNILYTDSWPDRGAGWMPALHQPSDPATFSLRLEIPFGYEAVASGTASGIDTVGSIVQYRWELSASAPTYTYAFAVGDFTVISKTAPDSPPINHYMLAGDEVWVEDLKRTPQILDFFSDLIGPYAYESFSSVEVPFSFAGMENASAIFLQAQAFKKGAIESIAVHEAAHQWFGNRVVIADWRDLWLSEGMATYLSSLFYESVDGLEEARQRWQKMAFYKPSSSHSNTILVPKHVTDPYDQLTWVPYRKGACVLHVLRHKLGDDVFFAALKATYREYAGKPIDSQAFMGLLESHSGLDLDTFFDYWVYNDRIPVLRTTWSPSTRTLQWEVVGDEKTLDGIPYQLAVIQGRRSKYISVLEKEAVLSGWLEEQPSVQPVGVLLRVE